MSRLTNALLSDTAFSKGAKAPMLDIINGGQNGWTPDLKQWISNQAYMRRNLICILLEAPKFFSLMDDSAKWIASLKSLMELHARTIEGLNAGLKVDFDEHPVGGAGEFQQEITDVKRDRSEPTFTFIEKYGMPIQTFLSAWIKYGMADPNTKYPLIGTLSGTVPSDMLADWFTASCLFIEPDPTHKRAVKSWVGTNMMPKGTGEIIGKRDLTSASEILTLSVEFTGIFQFGMGSDGTNIFAQKILDSINLNKADPAKAPSFISDIAADVKVDSEGYMKNITTLANSAGS